MTTSTRLPPLELYPDTPDDPAMTVRDKGSWVALESSWTAVYGDIDVEIHRHEARRLRDWLTEWLDR